jgi:glycine cleavage system aminomethyltransferase T
MTSSYADWWVARTLWKVGLVAARQTPFHNVGMDAGAEMQELFGYWLPWQYERGHVEEHVATRNRVSICDLDYMAEFKIAGPAALPFVQALLTNDFANLGIGRVRYTAMCDLGGNMVDDGTLWRLADNEYPSSMLKSRMSRPHGPRWQSKGPRRAR